MYIYIDR